MTTKNFTINFELKLNFEEEGMEIVTSSNINIPVEESGYIERISLKNFLKKFSSNKKMINRLLDFIEHSEYSITEKGDN